MIPNLVVVLGATGAQGSSIVRYLFEHSSDLFRVRAICRDPTKPASKALATLGAEVVAADFSDEDSMKSAFYGANVIFAITNFWDRNSLELEVMQGKLINKLASQVPELEHYILSSLPDARSLEGGKFQNILPYNAKANIREDLHTCPALAAKTTELWVAFYYENWLKNNAVFGPQKNLDGSFILSMPFPPSSRFPTSWAGDTGPLVDSLLRGGIKYRGKRVALAGDMMEQDKMLSIWAAKLGVKAVFEHATVETHLQRMSQIGLPDDLALAVTELSQTLPLELGIFEGENMLQGRELLPKHHRQKTWEEYVINEDWSSVI